MIQTGHWCYLWTLAWTLRSSGESAGRVWEELDTNMSVWSRVARNETGEVIPEVGSWFAWWFCSLLRWSTGSTLLWQDSALIVTFLKLYCLGHISTKRSVSLWYTAEVLLIMKYRLNVDTVTFLNKHGTQRRRCALFGTVQNSITINIWFAAHISERNDDRLNPEIPQNWNALLELWKICLGDFWPCQDTTNPASCQRYHCVCKAKVRLLIGCFTDRHFVPGRRLWTYVSTVLLEDNIADKRCITRWLSYLYPGIPIVILSCRSLVVLLQNV